MHVASIDPAYNNAAATNSFFSFNLLYLNFLLLFCSSRHTAPPSTLSSSCTSFHHPLVSKLVRTHLEKRVGPYSILPCVCLESWTCGSCATLARALSTDLLFLDLTVSSFLRCCHRFCRLVRQTCVVKRV